MKRIVAILIVIGLVVGSFAAGFYLRSSGIMEDEKEVPDKIPVPEWEPGRYWVYAYETGLVERTIAKSVNTYSDEDNYHLGIDNRLDAQRHAVLNYNPMLGRITKENLGIYEEGEPQTILLFPLREGSSWKFNLLGLDDFEARVKTMESVHVPGEGRANLVHMEATHSSGAILTYTYDSSAQWLRSMILMNSTGEEVLRMTLISYGTGHSGDVYFIRARDLYDRQFDSGRVSPEVEVYDTFIDRGHPDWGPWDDLIYYYSIETGSSSHALLTLRDHSTTTVVRKTFDTSNNEDGLGVVASNAGEWGVTVSLQGNCHLELKIAGGIEYVWTV